VTDGWVLPESIPGALVAGHGDDVPLLVGATANEAIIFQVPRDLERYRALVEEASPAVKDRLFALYPATNADEAQSALIRYVTDRDFVCPARFVAAKRHGPTWLYSVSAPPAPDPARVRARPRGLRRLRRDVIRLGGQSGARWARRA
jgi:carboxylesterase type B